MSISQRPQQLQTANLIHQDDGFAHRFSLPDDPRFWIRIEYIEDETVIVSDLFSGSQSEEQMARYFERALSVLELSYPSKFRFAALGLADDPGVGLRITEIEKMVELSMSGKPQFLVQRQTEIIAGKVSLLLTIRDMRQDRPDGCT